MINYLEIRNRTFQTAWLVLVSVILISGCGDMQIAPDSGIWDEKVQVRREFRGVWIATVANIDWPSKPGLPVDEQKEELRQILNRAAAMNLNAVIFQVRPAADALYDSPYEPWSAFLTGKMGLAPFPWYDPLEFAVHEARKRGLELHAWFNPFRAGHPADTSKPSPGHISRKHPGFVHQFGDYRWIDPGVPEAREYSRRVILDVVKRYDIDGVHLDDYFYPYPSYAEGTDFPDSLSWKRAVKEGTTMSRDEWRRNNIDRFIEELYRDIKETKPHVKFGISPFGTWRPGHPVGTGGFDAYEELYADARRWLREGWVDYYTPQLYNKIDRVIRPFPVILQWWVGQNITGRHIWPGLYTSRVESTGRSWPVEEITGQVYIARGQPGVTGTVHFRMETFMNNPKRLSDRLVAGPYAKPALVPASPWLDSIPPGPPKAALEVHPQELMVSVAPAEGDEVRWWVLRSRGRDHWEIDIIPGVQQKIVMHGTRATVWPDTVTVSAVDRSGNEGPGAVLPLHENFQDRQRDEANPFPAPDIVEREAWGEQPGGHPANAVRRNLSEGETLRFRDLTVVLDEMRSTAGEAENAGANTLNETGIPGTTRITLYRYSVAEQLEIPEGKAFNWYGYHIGVLAVHTDENELGSGLTELEIGTVASLNVSRAAAMETGGASQRLRVPHEIRNITLHHSGSSEPLTPEDDPVEKLRGLYSWGAQARNWWDVPYHYLIDLDGTIFEGRDARFAGDTNTGYDPRGHLLVTVLGNYNRQKPTPEQIEAIAGLMAWTVEKYDVPVDRIYGHYHWADTSCPGRYLRPLLENGILQQAIEKRLKTKTGE